MARNTNAQDQDASEPSSDHETTPNAQVVTIGAAELAALRAQAARVPVLEARLARLENDRRVWLAEFEAKLRANRVCFINCAAEFAHMKHLYSMR